MPESADTETGVDRCEWCNTPLWDYENGKCVECARQAREMAR